MRVAYAWSNTVVKEKVGLSAGPIRGEIQYSTQQGK